MNVNREASCQSEYEHQHDVKIVIFGAERWKRIMARGGCTHWLAIVARGVGAHITTARTTVCQRQFLSVTQ